VLHGFLDQLTHGFASRVLVGDAGVGKTALFRAAAASASERGYRVLSCRPAEADAHLSFAGLADVLMDAVDDEALDTLPEPQQRALNVVLLLQSPGKAPIDQRTVSAAVLSTVRTLAQRGPLVVAIDDLQWLDAASASTLAFAVRRLQDQDRIGVLATIRLGAAREEPHDLLKELIARGAPRLAVGPLDMSTTGRIIAQRLGSELPINVLRRIREVSGGNAFFALEIARAIIEEGCRKNVEQRSCRWRPISARPFEDGCRRCPRLRVRRSCSHRPSPTQPSPVGHINLGSDP
jgi:AAA ATPase domain